MTGSYCKFMAKMYRFDSTRSNWTETIIPPVKYTGDMDCESDYNFDFDEYCGEYFDGSDIALSDDGQSVAIAGIHWGTNIAIVRLLKLGEPGNWTMRVMMPLIMMVIIRRIRLVFRAMRKFLRSAYMFATTRRKDRERCLFLKQMIRTVGGVHV